jgi:Histidine phosphatase superfamily (branch 1)
MATGQATRNENNAAAADSSTPVTMDEIAATALLASPSIARHATSPRASSLSPALLCSAARPAAPAALAGELADEEIDLSATSELERARQTANIALADKALPRIMLSELNDPQYSCYEGGPLESYIAWALVNNSAAEPPGGERRQRLVGRYATEFRKLLERLERTILIVTHSLPVAYVCMALDGQDPAARVPLVEYAKIHAIAARELEQAVTRLESWCAAPTW